MNSFWNLLDWILPSIRLSDDLADPEALRIDNANGGYSYADTPSSYPPRRFSTQPQAVDRSRGQGDSQDERAKERRKEKERERQREQEREKDRQRILTLEHDNALLTQKISQLQRELQTSQRTIDTLNFFMSPGSPSSLPPAIPSAPPADPTALRNAYDTLLSAYSLSHRALMDRSEEVSSLQTFLSKTDDFSGAQLIQALRDLNSEIVQLAASIAEEFSSSMHRPEDSVPHPDIKFVTSALGPAVANLLASRDHASDPTLVQFAVQAWEVVCIGKALEAFCFGLTPAVDHALSELFQHMHASEPQPTTSRWRALTHAHARSLIASSAPTNARSSSPFKALTESNLRGLLAILHVSGCADTCETHPDRLRERFGPSIDCIVERAESIATATKEGVMSAAFDVVRLGTGKNAPVFNSVMMENVYAGHGREEGHVLCTVEFGLMCLKRVNGYGDEVNGQESIINGANGKAVAHGYARVNGNRLASGSIKTANGDGVITRSLLIKPKVLLNSVTEIL